GVEEAPDRDDAVPLDGAEDIKDGRLPCRRNQHPLKKWYQITALLLAIEKTSDHRHHQPVSRGFVDDLKILTPWLLVDQNMILTSLRILVLREFALTSLTPADERALKTLAPSLQCLMFHTCPNLEHLPADLRGLLPNLKCLVMSECPKLRHLPAEELPEVLEVLAINECPEMKEGLANARRHKQLDLLRIPVWTIDGEYQTGSYSMFQELRAKWDFRIFIEGEGEDDSNDDPALQSDEVVPVSTEDAFIAVIGRDRPGCVLHR
ncbi:hypothetical protein Taro_034698, partial [Colocasia esculenta]|nr:hypothetical protein [Colocasia esculenta]